jgi:uncharacterized membrane protein YtjA (UPF0391 family)
LPGVLGRAPADSVLARFPHTAALEGASSSFQWAPTFFVIALSAAFLGFGGDAGLWADIGWLFAVVGLIILVVAVSSGRGPPAVSGQVAAECVAWRGGGERNPDP